MLKESQQQHDPNATTCLPGPGEPQVNGLIYKDYIEGTGAKPTDGQQARNRPGLSLFLDSMHRQMETHTGHVR